MEKRLGEHTHLLRRHDDVELPDPERRDKEQRSRLTTPPTSSLAPHVIESFNPDQDELLKRAARPGTVPSSVLPNSLSLRIVN
jgi:hypothetical protein